MHSTRIACWLVVIYVVTLSPNLARAQINLNAITWRTKSGGVPTMGGLQFWADEQFFHKWRIQRNVITDRCRLLDENNHRHALGSMEECTARLDEIRRQRQLPPMRGKAVLLLHGLAATRTAMAPMAAILENQGDFLIFNVGYPSTRRSIEEHAKALANIVDHLDGIEEIHFVAHSLGNIVVRRYLGTAAKDAPNGLPDPRIKRFVMIGPPNHGSKAANLFANKPLVPKVLGKPLTQLGPQWAWLEGDLAVPACPFGIIAGGLGNSIGFNPILNGDDDGVVAVESTRLDGTTDFVVIPTIHSMLPFDPKTIDYSLRFLRKERFRDE